MKNYDAQFNACMTTATYGILDLMKQLDAGTKEFEFCVDFLVSLDFFYKPKWDDEATE